jgi:hypothetical protein
MNISETIKALEGLKAKHGDVEVTIWQYAGGTDNLCNISPVFDEEMKCVILDTTYIEGVWR